MRWNKNKQIGTFDISSEKAIGHGHGYGHGHGLRRRHKHT